MLLGVDRSRHNIKVPLKALVAKGVCFVIMKATQALTEIDPAFNPSWQEAKGIITLKRGAYAFFDPRFDGAAQAKHYLSLGINFSASGCLPPFVDVEDLIVFKSDGTTDNVATATANKWVADNWKLAVQRLQAFLDYVKQETGRDCIVYSYNNYMREYLHSTPFPNNEFWLSSLQATCPNRYDTGKPPLFWQWTYGWDKTDMDGNYFNGTIEQLNALANIP